jgi:nitrogen fixation protein NifU and related proteins
MPGLEDLYREIILDHYRNPRNRGELETPPAKMAEGFNPLCGDEIRVFLIVEEGKVTDIKVSGQGCSVSQSSASMMSQAVKGKTVDEAQAVIRTFKAMITGEHVTGEHVTGEHVTGEHVTGEHADHDDESDHDADHDHAVEAAPVKLGDLEALKGVVKFPARIKCATLAWNTLSQAIVEATA